MHEQFYFTETICLNKLIQHLNNSPENIQLLQKVISVMPFGYMKLKVNEVNQEGHLVIAEANAAAESICNALPGHLAGKFVQTLLPELTFERLEQSNNTENKSKEIFFSQLGKWCTLEVFYHGESTIIIFLTDISPQKRQIPLCRKMRYDFRPLLNQQLMASSI